VAGDGAISDARWGVSMHKLSDAQRRKYFGATCFTETPIAEIHRLLDVRYRQVNLQPYGLVFLKDNVAKAGVSPVFYLNNEPGDADLSVQALCSLIDTKPTSARRPLPLVSFFGKKINPVGAQLAMGRMDFRWEREWRYPASEGPLTFDDEDVFVGSCPDEEIDLFEQLMPGVVFIDPRRNMKWYADKLIDARKRLGIKISVV
jgi:hypothetical protein